MTAPSRFSFDPSAVQAGVIVLPKDDYEFIVGEPRVFSRTNQAGEPSFGLMFPLMVASEGEYKGKRIFQNFYVHTEAAWPMLKAFQLAVFGFNPNQEKSFNEQMKAENGEWDIDFEAKTVGDFWRKMTGQRVAATADVAINQKTEQEQNNFRWRPV